MTSQSKQIRYAGWWVALGVAIVVILSVAGCMEALRRKLLPDYSAMPPKEGFRSILKEPMPAGISEYACAHLEGLDRMVWVRFRATPAAIRTITARWKPESSAPKDLDERFEMLLHRRILPKRAKEIGWGRLSTHKKLLSWSKSTASSSHELYWDPATGDTYVHWMTE